MIAMKSVDMIVTDVEGIGSDIHIYLYTDLQVFFNVQPVIRKDINLLPLHIQSQLHSSQHIN